MQESEMQFIQSKINKDEAEFLLTFAEYLLANKYAPEQITILTLYSGQLIHLKKLIREKYYNLKDVWVSTVDNFQGEENDIILLSLVRSNKNNSIGFLKVSNRVCVALSRARQGSFNCRLLHFRKCSVSQELLPPLPRHPVRPTRGGEGAALDQGAAAVT